MNCYGRNGARPSLAWRRRGAAGTVLALLLPVVLASLALVADVGYLLWVRAALQAAADLGALAGAQELDLEALAEGRRALAPTAGSSARRWAGENLAAHPATARWADLAEVGVLVIQADEQAPARHPWTGRTLRDPTVAVRIRLRVPLPWFGRPLGPVEVVARADASVRFRR